MSQICPCPNPPGGHIICSDEQLAIRGYRNGQVVSGCFDRPSDAPLGNWAMYMITGVWRPINGNDRLMLQSEQYQDPATGTVIHFRLPVGFPLI